MTSLHTRRDGLTPIQVAMEMYSLDGQSFEEVLMVHAMYHYVYSAPECFIMARKINRADAEARRDQSGSPDTWFIECASGPGSLKRFMNLMPFYLPWVAFARGVRGGLLRFYDTNSIKGTICSE